MRILLITLSDLLPLVLIKILNPALECCAIVVDEPEKSKKLLGDNPLSNIIYPFYELKECIEKFYFDCIVCPSPFWEFPNYEYAKKSGIPNDLLVSFSLIHAPENFFVERALRHYKEHVSEFEMFATGSSYVHHSLDTKKFTHKLFNFGHPSQDLYYNFQIAKYVLTEAGGSDYIKYALIGFFPQHLHYDESKTIAQNGRLLQYVIAFNDVHNFWLSIEKYKSLLNPEYLKFKLPLENEMDRITPLDTEVKYISLNGRLLSRERIDVWQNKSYPDTVKENVKILDDYLTLCEENNVRPIIFTAPMTYGYMKYFSKKKLDEFQYVIGNALKKHSTAVFFDGWKLQGVSDYDFFDVDHMNIQGAAKFSTILNDFIENLEN